ncbi:tetratricopeptide repeat protein [Acidithiobacillus concretivorus]|uniref:Sel1 repeat family protein n=1 Tax=Acidithiobacillus concretivorus TaxID=3063952 RepID=A0ABS5ZQE5_9PROT|nr:tetratricopeptide repeat protein [Acidithiobacillus concretivorus]MBU2738893.1 sel1 repeat family protein [Acidithiobacillus concretivorus]
MYYRLIMKGVLICYVVLFMSITTYAFSETPGSLGKSNIVRKPESTHHDSLSDLHTRIFDNRKKIIALLNKGAYNQTIPMLINAVKSDRDSWAADTLGNLYLAGLGVKQNQELAFNWFSIAAKLGSIPAQRQLVNAYMNGNGVNQNPSESAYFFRKYLAPLQWAGAYCGVF